MAEIYVKSGGGTEGTGSYRGVWSAGKTWAVGDRIVATNVVSYRVMECTTGGAGGAGAEPAWNTTTGGTTTDSSAVWTTRIPTTWANATVDLTRAAANDAAGDTIYVSHQHAESTAAAVTLAWAGNAANPTKVLCVNDAAEPPTTLATTATITTTGNNAIQWGTGVEVTYAYGLTFTPGSGATGTAGFYALGLSTFDSCNAVLGGTGASSPISLGSATTPVTWVNSGVKFGAAGQGIGSTTAGSRSKLTGGSLLAGGTSPTALFTSLASNTTIEISGLDLANANAAVSLFSVSANSVKASVRNSRLPPGWSGNLFSGTPSAGAIYEMFNCDSGDTNYRYRKAAQFGTIQDETTLVRTGGASDGTTTISHRMVTNANAEYPMLTLDSPEYHSKWNSTVGSAITATIEFLHDSATALKDNEIWMEAMYLGTSGTPLALFVDDAAADVLATAADQTDSSETWTTTGMANPNTQKINVTFTPQEAGVVVCVVKVAKASTSIYIDPFVVLT